MTSSATQDYLSEVLSGSRIPANKLAYFQTRLSGNIHQAILKTFGLLERQGDFTRRDLASRIGRKPEQITRWLSYPGNLTLGTVSDIFIGMGYELESVTLVDLATSKRVQFPNHQADWARIDELYAREHESATASVPGERNTTRDQTARSHASARSQWTHKPMRHSALQGFLPSPSGIGKAEAAQLSAANSNTPIGQEV